MKRWPISARRMNCSTQLPKCCCVFCAWIFAAPAVGCLLHVPVWTNLRSGAMVRFVASRGRRNPLLRHGIRQDVRAVVLPLPVHSDSAGAKKEYSLASIQDSTSCLIQIPKTFAALVHAAFGRNLQFLAWAYPTCPTSPGHSAIPGASGEVGLAAAHKGVRPVAQ